MGILRAAGGRVWSPHSVAGLWSWCWAGSTGQNVTHTGGTYPEITRLVNLASPGVNDYTNDIDDARPAYQVGVTAAGYSTTLPAIGLDSYSDATAVGRQTLSQSTDLDAAGEFYLCMVFLNTRTGGERFVLGDEAAGHYIRISQASNYVEIALGGAEIKITETGDLPVQCILEVWRDSSDDLHCWINGADQTDGSPNDGTLFELNGFGGGIGASASAWDDFMFEFLVYDELPSTADRLLIRTYENDRWGMY